MTKRQQVLEAIRVAAYNNDLATATRLLIEHRIGRKAYDEAVELGRQQARMGRFAKTAPADK